MQAAKARKDATEARVRRRRPDRGGTAVSTVSGRGRARGGGRPPHARRRHRPDPAPRTRRLPWDPGGVALTGPRCLTPGRPCSPGARGRPGMLSPTTPPVRGADPRQAGRPGPASSKPELTAVRAPRPGTR
ncbi:hypothetical protein HBB16_04815 [Pseudonocardia sp. MCCB 268]|nr:hypothetical protein [Pseudonocardia cytotoxica]